MQVGAADVGRGDFDDRIGGFCDDGVGHALHPDIIFDLKKSVDVTRSGWLRSALGFHYDMQAYMYSLAECLFSGRERPLPFVFVVGENSGPYSVSAFTAGESFIAKGGKRVNAKSIMGVMMLAAGKGTKVTLDTNGADEAEAMDAVTALIADKFGEGE